MKTKQRQTEDAVEAAGVLAAVGPRLDQAREWAAPRVGTARDWAAPRFEQARDLGIGVAAPRLEAAATRLGPAIESTRDRLVDDVLPRVTIAAREAANRAEESRALLAAAVAESGTQARSRIEKARKEAAQRAAEARKAQAKAEAEARKATKRAGRRRGAVLGRLLALLAVLGAGAAVFAVLRRRRAEGDPWAQPYPTFPATGDPGEEQQPETDVTTVITPVTDAAGPGTGHS